MKIGFVINDLKTEDPKYTTMWLGQAATATGHEAWIIDVGDFSYDPSSAIYAHARSVSGDHANSAAYWAALNGPDARQERIATADLDILMFRHDPSEEAERRPWAQFSPLLFGQLAAKRGTIVVNDPHSLSYALNKTYFQQFPDAVRPRTLISTNKQEIRNFVKDQGSDVVLKPLQGSGGKNVFVIRKGDTSNLMQIIEVIASHGYVVAQEYLPQAVQGDVRLFVMNGQPLCVGGRYAAIRRIAADGEVRNNVHAGGRVEPVEVTEEMLGLVEAVRPKLVKDGMFLVGLDMVGNKLMEVNVFTPGGLHAISEVYGVDFARAVIEALERKTCVRRNYRTSIDNVDLATL